MGTNYYLKQPNKEQLHIGKSSSGWCFFLHVKPNKNIHTLDDWFLFFNSSENIIIDEYNQIIEPDNMMNIIINRSCNPKKWGLIARSPFFNYATKEEFLERNQALEGPNDLLRCIIDNKHCIGHGEGTWDYIIGDFS